MSQDHLELLFGAIRSHGSSSNNPTVTQFQVIYKRLLMRNEVNKFIYIYIYIYIYNDIYIKQVKCSNGNVGIMDGTFITRSIRIKINCDQCSDALVSHTITSQLINRKNGGGLINPSEDVVNICLYVERLLTPRIVDGVLSNTKIYRLKVASLRSVSDNTLFTKLLQHSYVAGDLGVDHRIIIITNIIAKYINIRLFQISKLINQKNCIKRIRKKFTKLILFNNE